MSYKCYFKVCVSLMRSHVQVKAGLILKNLLIRCKAIMVNYGPLIVFSIGGLLGVLVMKVTFRVKQIAWAGLLGSAISDSASECWVVVAVIL